MDRLKVMNSNLQFRLVAILAALGALVLLMIAAAPYLLPPDAVGSPLWSMTMPRKSIEIIETLKESERVSHWTSDRLVLTSGRAVRLPGVARLPKSSGALVEAIRSGVEVGASFPLADRENGAGEG